MDASAVREIPMGVLLTATTGRLLARGGWGEFQEFAEWLYQRPIWTHEFVALADPLRRDVLAQHPDLPADDAGITPSNFKARLGELEAQYGAARQMRTVTTQPRTADPLTTLAAVFNKEVPDGR